MKNILKKAGFAKLAILSLVLLATILAGCPNEPAATTTDNTSQSQGDSTTTTTTTPTTTPTTVTFQSQIDAAAAGSTVTLNRSNTGSSITINKALTVNGNQVENLSIIIASNVSSSVTLQNFKNATISVSSASSSSHMVNSRSAYSARTVGDNDSEEADRFSKIGDGDLPLHIEGCTIDRLELEKDVALYLENGEKKSTIEELSLREGVEEFSFIEFDENGKEISDRSATATAAKSRVEKLSIEDDGVAKINLIGGVFDDVDFADGVSASDIDSLKYDREFSDQFGTDAARDLRDAITDESKKEDVGIAKRTSSSTDATVYKFTVPHDIFQAIDGKMTIVLMNAEQSERLLTNNEGLTWFDEDDISIIHSVANFNTPLYAIIPAGFFCVDWHSTNNLKTIFGSESAYVDYASVFARGEISYRQQDVVLLDHYRNYNKEAFIVEVDGNNVNLYVNMAAIKKSDVILCNAETVNGVPSYGESGSKLTEIDLTGYTPYLAFDKFIYKTVYTSDEQHREPDMDDDAYNENGVFNNAAFVQAHNAWETAYNAAYQSALNPITHTHTDQGGTTFTDYIESSIPYGNSVKFTQDPTFNFKAPETSNTPVSYPDVSNVVYTEKQTDPTKGRELLNQSFDSRD